MNCENDDHFNHSVKNEDHFEHYVKMMIIRNKHYKNKDQKDI